MTPKEALNLIKQFVPNVTEIRKVEYVSEPTVFGVGPQAIIEWGDTTSYKQTSYREPTIDDVTNKVLVEVDHYGEWVEATLIGVVFYDKPLWYYRVQQGVYATSQCRVPVE